MSHQVRPTLRFGLLSLLLALAFSLLALPAAAQTITVHRGTIVVNDLYLGNDLRVSVSGALPFTSYTLGLYDETKNLVVARNVLSNGQGEIGTTVLWSRSGVVGCDPNAVPDPLNYRFRTFEDVEALHGRTFTIALLTQNLALVTSRTVALTAYTGYPRFYYSDGAACPRFNLHNANQIYLAAIHLPIGAQQAYTHWASSVPLGPTPWTDIRPNYPNGMPILVPGTSAYLVTLAFANVQGDLGCFYGTVVSGASPTGGLTGGGLLQGASKKGSRTGGTGFPSSFKTFAGSGPGGDPNTDPAFNCPPCVENNIP